jgi:hypothetical protein
MFYIAQSNEVGFIRFTVMRVYEVMLLRSRLQRTLGADTPFRSSGVDTVAPISSARTKLDGCEHQSNIAAVR